MNDRLDISEIFNILERAVKPAIKKKKKKKKKKISQKCCSYPPVPKCQNGSALLNKIVTRAKIEKKKKNKKKKTLNDISVASGKISK